MPDLRQQLHESVVPLGHLLGTWRGEGQGHYPTIDDFTYGEEVMFTTSGKPHLIYVQRTWSLRDGSPMHSEMGFWNPHPGGRLEVVLAHPFGIAEIIEGTFSSTRIELTSTTLSKTTSAKEIYATTRLYEILGNVLTYDVQMAFEGPMRPHLSAHLTKV